MHWAIAGGGTPGPSGPRRRRPAPLDPRGHKVQQAARDRQVRPAVSVREGAAGAAGATGVIGAKVARDWSARPHWTQGRFGNLPYFTYTNTPVAVVIDLPSASFNGVIAFELALPAGDYAVSGDIRFDVDSQNSGKATCVTRDDERRVFLGEVNAFRLEGVTPTDNAFRFVASASMTTAFTLRTRCDLDGDLLSIP